LNPDQINEYSLNRPINDFLYKYNLSHDVAKIYEAKSKEKSFILIGDNFKQKIV